MASSLSTVVMFLSNVRATGSKDAAGITHGGIYYPAHTKNGVQVSARWEGNVVANSRDWTDAQGQHHEGNRTYMRLVAWNSKNSAHGKGLADIMAKHMSVGKAISCSVMPESFEKRIFMNGQPLMMNNQQVTHQAIVFRMTGDLVFGDDSSKTIAAEVSRWNGEYNFISRPPEWNIPGTAGYNAWKALINARSNAQYNGGDTYGYARVIVPQNAQLVNPQMPPNQGQLNTGINPQAQNTTDTSLMPSNPVDAGAFVNSGNTGTTTGLCL